MKLIILDNSHNANILFSIQAVAQQLLDFTDAGANDDYFNEKLQELSLVVSVSSDQLQSIVTNVRQGSTDGMECINYIIE